MKKLLLLTAFTLSFYLNNDTAKAQCSATVTPQGVCSGTPFTGGNISSGTNIAQGNQTITSQNVIMSGGTLILCSDTLTVTSSQLHLGFNSTGPVQIIINPGATLNISLSNLYLYSNTTLTNYGTINILSGGASFIAGYTNASLINASSGVIQSAVAFTLNGTNGSLVNYGTITTPGITVSATSNVCLASNSRLSTTNLTNAGTNHSMFNLVSGASQACLQIAAGGTYTAGGAGNIISNNSGVRICSGSATTPTGTNAGSATVSYFCTSCSVALPLLINGFHAQKSGDKAILSLNTLNEKNIIGFELERSEADGAFERISNLVAANNNEQNEYQFTDEHPYSGINLYRIKITELNNVVRYSSTSSLNFAASRQTIAIYPNPAHNDIKVDLSGTQSSDKIRISLVDLYGRNIAPLYEGTSEAAPVEHSLQNILPGIYMMQVLVNNALVSREKITVIK